MSKEVTKGVGDSSMVVEVIVVENPLDRSYVVEQTKDVPTQVIDVVDVEASPPPPPPPRVTSRQEEVVP